MFHNNSVESWKCDASQLRQQWYQQVELRTSGILSNKSAGRTKPTRIYTKKQTRDLR